MISVTENASAHIAAYLLKRGSGIGIRLGVRSTGCSGLAYQIEYCDAKEDDDTIFISCGISIFVDPKSLPYLDGTVLDYTKEGLQEGFAFLNPNQTSVCGCGESFKV
jgi:iron-sulfur cluster assembly protein